MNFYSKTLFLDQFTPVSIYEKTKALYPKELSFLFESSISSSNDGNFSYIIIGARERIWYKNNECFFKNEIGNIEKVDNNPLLFLKKYYKNFEKNIYKEKSKELGIGLIDGFIGNVGYDMGKEFEPRLKASMNSLQDELNIPDLDLIRPKIILAFSHKTSKLVILTSMNDLKNEIENIEKELLKPYIYTPLKKAKLIDNGKFNFTKEEFFSIVEKSKEMIRAGDIFQILISNRFTQQAVVDSLSFYRALRSKNPSTYLFLLELEDFSIAGSSPE
ncbi:MAG: chorismate-binding protein, partial [Aliarcobacter cryaerophilus]